MENQSSFSSTDFICIQRWMLDILGLKTNELLIYAIIYGYSKGGQGEYFGSLKYLESWTGATKKTVITSLASLVEKEYIKKTEYFVNGVKMCRYSVNNDYLPTVVGNTVVKKSEENYTGGVKITPPGEKITPNNIEDNIVRTKDDIEIVTSDSKDTKENDSICAERMDLNGEQKNKKVTEKKTKSAKEVRVPNCEEYRQLVFDKGYEDRLEKRVLDWLEYKAERGDKYAPTGFKALLKQIDNNSMKYGVGKMCKCIDTCMGRQYMGIVFELLEKMDSDRPKYNRLD